MIDKPICTIAAILAILLVQLGCDRLQGKKSSPSGEPPTKAKVEVIVVGTSDLDEKVELPATIESFEKTPLFSRIDGLVHAVRVDIGDFVTGPREEGEERTAGQELITLDVPEMLAEKTRREKLLQKSKADFKGAETDFKSAEADVTQAEAKREEQEALLGLREAELASIKALVASGSLNRIKEREAEYARAAVVAAMSRVNADVAAAKARQSSAASRITSAEAEVAVAQAELDKTIAMGSYMTIRAPYDGVITERHIHPGALVRPGDPDDKPLLVIENIEKLRLIVFAPIEDAFEVDDGDTITIDNIQGRQDLELPPLTISRYAKSFHRGSRMMRVEALIDNLQIDKATGPWKLKPGDYGKVTLTLRTHADIATVPKDALIQREDGDFVMVVDSDNTCRLTAVDVNVIEQKRDKKGRVIGGKAGIVTKHGEILKQRVIIKEVNRFKDGQELSADSITEK